MPVQEVRVPGAAQHELLGRSSRPLMVRCRPGIVTKTACWTVPGLHRNVTPKSVMYARDTLAVFAAGTDAGIELEVIADHTHAVEISRAIADQHGALERGAAFAIF